MELKIDLLAKKEKSRYRMIYGVAVILFAIFYLVFVLNKEIFGLNLYWIFFGIFILATTISSIFHFIEGLGYQFESFFGEAYILIDSEIISLKSSVYNKRQFVNWNEIKSINYNLIHCEFKIEKIDNTIQIINISKFDYALMVEIKKAVSSIAKEKNIQSNI